MHRLAVYIRPYSKPSEKSPKTNFAKLNNPINMKYQISFFAILGLLMILPLTISAELMPNPNLKVRSEVKAEKQIKVLLVNMMKVPTKVTITSMEGERILYEMVRDHNGYSFDIDLSQLPNGRYLLEVSQKDEERSQVIRIDNGKVLLSEVV